MVMVVVVVRANETERVLKHKDGNKITEYLINKYKFECKIFYMTLK